MSIRSVVDKIQEKAALSANVIFLDGSEKSFCIKWHLKGCNLLKNVNTHLKLFEPEYFGLQFVHEGDDVVWVEPGKLFRNQWCSVKGDTDDSELTLKFRVRIYAADPCKLFPRTRHYFYLQIKHDIYSGKLPSSVKQTIQLASYIAQIEEGDYISKEREPGYLDEYALTLGQNEEFERRVADMHKLHRGLSVREAELKYLETAKKLDLYGVYLYKAMDDCNIEIQIGISLNGILLYNDAVLEETLNWYHMTRAILKGKNVSLKFRKKPGEECRPPFKCSMCSSSYAKSFWDTLLHYYAFSRGEKLEDDKISIRDKISQTLTKTKCKRIKTESSEYPTQGTIQPQPEPNDPYDQIFHSSLKLLCEGIASGCLDEQFRQVARKNHKLPMTVAKLPDNHEKNYRELILPYDCNRVVLPDCDCQGDYINASHVEMKTCNLVNRYIATQAPLINTTLDFWRMVQAEHVHLIVMLTAVMENGVYKCHQYWPELDGELQLAPGFSVKCVIEQPDETGSYVFRELVLIDRNQAQVERSIEHMQYLAWPDNGVPTDSLLFLQFRQRVEDMRKSTKVNDRISTKDPPIIIHCTAGIGRTGVFIFVDTAMTLLEAWEPIYPSDLLRTMRDQRAGFVLKSHLYRFACECICEQYQNIVHDMLVNREPEDE